MLRSSVAGPPAAAELIGESDSAASAGSCERAVWTVCGGPARSNGRSKVRCVGQSASAGPGGIVYEQFGKIFIYDTAANKSTEVPIEIEADLSEVRPHFQNVARDIRNARISPTGVRAVFEAHGEILTAPAEKGDIRNLTHTPGVMDRTPVWSPDGHSIAYFSDANGQYALHVSPQNGEGDAKKIALAIG